MIFGGAGIRIVRNNHGDLAAEGHARDADVILGDNGNIYRLVGTDGRRTVARVQLRHLRRGAEPIMPRAFAFLDYTAGRRAATDIGAADLVHGEDGDDTIHGMAGNDVLFGEGQDDDLYGGGGNDRIYGGTGEDGILGDDGMILTSRNGLTEPLQPAVHRRRRVRADRARRPVHRRRAWRRRASCKKAGAC